MNKRLTYTLIRECYPKNDNNKKMSNHTNNNCRDYKTDNNDNNMGTKNTDEVKLRISDAT